MRSIRGCAGWADTRGERGERCRGQRKRPERVAAVGGRGRRSVADESTGHRNRRPVPTRVIGRLCGAERINAFPTGWCGMAERINAFPTGVGEEKSLKKSGFFVRKGVVFFRGIMV